MTSKATSMTSGPMPSPGRTANLREFILYRTKRARRENPQSNGNPFSCPGDRKELALGRKASFFIGMLEWIRQSWYMTSGPARAAWIIVLFFIAVLLGLLVWVVRNWLIVLPDANDDLSMHRTTDFSSAIREASKGGGSVQLLTIAERAVLDRHFGALGGLEQINAITSLRFSGKVTFDTGVVQSVVVIKKGGDRMRTTVKSKVSQTTWVISPESNWRAVWFNGQLAEVRDLTESELDDSLLYIHVVSELYLAQKNNWDLRYLGVKEFNYKMAHVFEVQPDPRYTIQYFIEPKTFLDVGRVDKVFEKDGTLNITRRVHLEHFDANGLSLPGKVETYLNGNLIQTFELQRAQFNSGVLDEVFIRPNADLIR